MDQVCNNLNKSHSIGQPTNLNLNVVKSLAERYSGAFQNLMTEVNDLPPMTTVHAGDQHRFEQSTEPYRRELLVHCYRVLGSMEDAEDALQETLLRAWRHLESLKTQTSLRAWLYKIATNVSLDMLDNRKVRLMPNATHVAADPDDPLPGPINDPIWLDPLPDVYLDGYISNPEAHYEARESITLAFLTALQRLPGRQRAILILRDVLGWKAQDVADLLDLSVAAVNSALQRARGTLKKHHDTSVTAAAKTTDKKQIDLLLSRYVQAWEFADSASLIALLREDAVLTMPPLPAWYRGHRAIKSFLDHHLFTEKARGSLQLVPTRANGSPAFAVYQRDEKGQFRLAGLQILTFASDQIAQIDDFLAINGRGLSHFNLPLFR